eukprot:XP_001697298.1 predicted protein [Chlamydomonas reinhardtii]
MDSLYGKLTILGERLTPKKGSPTAGAGGDRGYLHRSQRASAGAGLGSFDGGAAGGGGARLGAGVGLGAGGFRDQLAAANAGLLQVALAAESSGGSGVGAGNNVVGGGHAAGAEARYAALMNQFLSVKEQLEAVKSEQDRAVREGCAGCARLREQQVQAHDAAANAAAQLREVQTQLQESRLAAATASASGREAALEEARRRLRELEASTTSAVASRQVTMEKDATLAAHGLRSELEEAKAALHSTRASYEAALEYNETLIRTLRKTGMPVPQSVHVGEVTSRISILQDQLRRESEQSNTDTYAQLEQQLSSSLQEWQQTAARDAAAISELTSERDKLRLEVHSLQMAGTTEVDEMARKVARFEVKAEALGSSKREAEERARGAAEELGRTRKALADIEMQLETAKMAVEDARTAAADAEAARKAAEARALEAERERSELRAKLEGSEEALARIKAELKELQDKFDFRQNEYDQLYVYCEEVIAEKDSAAQQLEGVRAALAAAEESVQQLGGEVDELREALADREAKLAVKPKMAELQYRVNDLTSQLEELGRRLAAVEAERDDTARKLQEETEAHFNTDGRRVRLGEEVERLRGILRMYSIPF